MKAHDDLTSLMNGGFKDMAGVAVTLAGIIKAKKAPDNAEKKQLFVDLQESAQMMAAEAEKGNYFSASVTMMFVQGLGLGLGVITKAELADLKCTQRS